MTNPGEANTRHLVANPSGGAGLGISVGGQQ